LVKNKTEKVSEVNGSIKIQSWDKEQFKGMAITHLWKTSEAMPFVYNTYSHFGEKRPK
jgi:hypothetical protein